MFCVEVFLKKQGVNFWPQHINASTGQQIIPKKTFSSWHIKIEDFLSWKVWMSCGIFQYLTSVSAFPKSTNCFFCCQKDAARWLDCWFDSQHWQMSTIWKVIGFIYIQSPQICFTSGMLDQALLRKCVGSSCMCSYGDCVKILHLKSCAQWQLSFLLVSEVKT